MKPGAPWSVKGIEPQARETAKSAARRAGMTLGEWLNQIILETGVNEAPVADPMRAPDDWMLETGAALPWTRPIEEMSAEVTARLAASEAENTALLGSIEAAIGGISRRLVELDERGPAGPGGALEARLSRIETVQKRALSKDHLKSLETAVSQISVVFDNQTGRQKAIIRAQDDRIDQSGEALGELADQLKQTEERANQALFAVEAAAELYDITDKQGQIVDSLVMDVAAVHAEQKKSDTRSSAELSSIADELGGLKAQFRAFEAKSAEVSSAPAEDVRLATGAISQQISENEEKAAESVAQIEEQIVGLSQILEKSLQAQQSGIEDLRASFDAILNRMERLEAQPEEENPQAPTAAAEQTSEAPATNPVTFKTLAQQNTRNVNVNMAVTIDPDFIRTAQEVEASSETELSDGPETTDPQDTQTAPPDQATLNVSVRPAEAEVEQQPETTPAPEDVEVVEISGITLEGKPENPEPEIEVIASADWETEVDLAISDHQENSEALANEPLTFADIFGGGEETVLDDTAIDGASDPVIDPTHSANDPEADAALREAVSNISNIRASWAAKNQAAGRPGSMRQIVDVENDVASRRGWALTASGVIVGLIAISGVLVYSGDGADLVKAGERPGLFDQITSWMPGQSSQPNTPETSTIPGGEPETILATQYGATTNLPASLEDAALAGDAKARFALGRAFANGDGRPVDRAAANKWYEAAAGQGLAIAQYVLGSLHERGIDVAQDSQVAIDWYAAAARGGNRRAMHNLAVAYARGDVITQDLAQSAYWFSEAAELGLSDAQYNLALLHERGLGTEKDLVTAWKWYRIAAAGGDSSAAAQAERLGSNLTPGQTKMSQAAIDTWRPREMDPIANGLFDITPAAYNNARQRSDLAVVQSHLMTLGYALAGSDGIMDPTTRKAIKTFQASNNLDVTGTISPGLYETLIAAKTNKSPSD